MVKHDELIRIVFLLLFLASLARLSYAQGSGLKPVTSTYAIRNVTIVQAPGRNIPNGTIIIENGIIKSVGTNISIPSGAWVVQADSMYVYAGFISGLSTIGVEKPKNPERDDDRKLTATPTYQRAGIRPDVNVRSMLNHQEKSVADFRKLGFTAAHSVPHGGMIGGTGAIILLGGSSSEDMVIKDEISMFSQWEGAGGVYPNTVIGIMAKYRDLYRKASQARTYASVYASSSSGMERPEADNVLEALYPVVAQQIPVAFKTENLLDVTRALTLKNDLGFNIILGEVKQAWDVIPQIKSAGAPVFLSFDLPEMEKEEKEEGEKEDDGEKNSEEEKSDPTPEEIEKEALEKRKSKMIKNYYTQPAKLSVQGVKFGFSTLEGKSKDFKGNMMKIISNGLSADQALASLTTSPAEILGVSSLMGTVDKGKMANLIVTDKPYFEEKSNIRYVFVDGVKYDYEVKEKKKKKSSGEEDIDPQGTWNYTYGSDGQSWNGTFTITGSKDNYGGNMYLSFNDSNNDILNVEIDGSSVSFEIEVSAGGETVTVSIEMVIDGESFEGSLTAGAFGTYDMEGSKDPKF